MNLEEIKAQIAFSLSNGMKIGFGRVFPAKRGGTFYFDSRELIGPYIFESIEIILILGACFVAGIVNNVPYIAIVFFLLLSIVLSYVLSGKAVDTEQNQYKKYIWIWGLRLGFWKSLEGYPDIIVLRRKIGAGHDVEGMPSPNIRYELYFATPNHFNNLFVGEFSMKYDAYESAEMLENAMGNEFVQYNPGKRNVRKKLSN